MLKLDKSQKSHNLLKKMQLIIQKIKVNVYSIIAKMEEIEALVPVGI
jgi:Txe/YoeB family toxin of Txe-Axe toxin-antitoxin module